MVSDSVVTHWMYLTMLCSLRWFAVGLDFFARGIRTRTAVARLPIARINKYNLLFRFLVVYIYVLLETSSPPFRETRCANMPTTRYVVIPARNKAFLRGSRNSTTCRKNGPCRTTWNWTAVNPQRSYSETAGDDTPLQIRRHCRE